MLEHAHRGDLVEAAVALHERVVALLEVDAIDKIETIGLLPRERDLLVGQCHAHDLPAIVHCCKAGERTPTAAVSSIVSPG